LRHKDFSQLFDSISHCFDVGKNYFFPKNAANSSSSFDLILEFALACTFDCRFEGEADELPNNESRGLPVFREPEIPSQAFGSNQSQKFDFSLSFTISA
jgi:hypothetical protein